MDRAVDFEVILPQRRLLDEFANSADDVARSTAVPNLTSPIRPWIPQFSQIK
jgi:hypothetical protein